MHRLRGCNAVREESQGDSSALASRRLAGPWTGGGPVAIFMARNRAEEKQGDQLSKRSLRKNAFDFLMRG